MNKICLYGNINGCSDLAQLLRQTRKAQGLTQIELAAISGVGQRFLSELENGKPTLEIGRILRVAAALGLQLRLEPRKWVAP